MNKLDAIKAVVEKFVRQNQWFTAFDITKALRHAGVRIHHHVVSMEARVLYGNGSMPDFRRTCVDVGASIFPLLYHPDGADPSGYDKNWLTTFVLDNLELPALLDDVSTVVAPVLPTGYTRPITTAPNSGNPHVSSILKTTNVGRLNIPNEFVKYAGFEANDVLVLDFNESKHIIQLSRRLVVDDDVYPQVVVNKDGRIRLGSCHLLRIAKNSNSTYTVRHMGRLAPNALEVVAE